MHNHLATNELLKNQTIADHVRVSLFEPFSVFFSELQHIEPKIYI